MSTGGAPLHGRVAIVTGASRGIGREIAIHLRSLGAKVAINYTSNSKQADLLTTELNTANKEEDSLPVAIAVKGDISNPNDVKTLFDRAEQAFGAPPHILVNSAGTLDPKYPNLSDMTLESFETTFNVNTKGAFLTYREAANRLVRGGGGRIIMITSSIVSGLMPGYGAYAGSKAAVETMMKVATKELKGSGITVNCVAPGPVATELFYAGKSEEIVKELRDACPLGRLGQPNDVAQVVVFLLPMLGNG